MKSVLKKEKIYINTTNTLVNAACLESINQDVNINGFVGMFSLINFIYQYKRDKIKYGTRLLMQKLLEISKANIKLNVNVKSISVLDTDLNKNRLIFEKDGVEYENCYDYIIIAKPLLDNKTFKIDFDCELNISNYNMKLIYVYFVDGILKIENVLLLLEGRHVKLVSSDMRTSYNRIESQLPVDYDYSNYDRKLWLTTDYRLFKIETLNELDDDSFRKLFKEYKIVQQFSFFAYPNYKLLEDAKEFQKFDKKGPNLSGFKKRNKYSRDRNNNSTNASTVTATTTNTTTVETSGDTDNTIKTNKKQPEESIYPNVVIDSIERSRVFYLNSIEWLASTMEMNCIAARNIALIVSNREQTKKITLRNNWRFAQIMRDYYNDACGIISALSIFALVYALWFKEPIKIKSKRR